ncbi:MAG: LysR family transcriptional regulator [Sulfobacillus acidophilus]|uniref:LysR family transcriptional regulator n=1 Tax=Sulfobacillus acidophilus TaxID=53633 RepID=A0A2T2WFY4_9FIRM|nr:MAG: LysR family transcriptional regulator [Sulfobacillus acidophilus]
MSQPSASRRLKAMEQELGAALVDRTVSPVSLTPFGFLFLDFADDILKRYRALKLSAGQNHSVIGRLTVATSTSPAARLVTRWMADFITAHPGVHLELREMSSQEVEQRIANNDASIGFMGVPAHSPDITSYPIGEDEIVLLIPHHPLFANLSHPVLWESLYALPFICRRPGSGTQSVINQALIERGWPLCRHIVLEVDTGTAIIDAVESGLGAGFVSRELLFRRELRRARPVAVKDFSITRPFYLAYRPHRLSTDAVAYQFLRYASLRLEQLQGS